MEKKKILFVTQEITPYLPESHLSKIGRFLPQGIQERGKEIRTFMPRFGNINERRNQLHEVIRLSGMNLIIDDKDNPLIIKVASIQKARMQVYFIDNDDFFKRRFMFRDKNEKFFEDNDERTIFFSRGVIETVKKLGWPPDLVHCHGWMSTLIPLYVKRVFNDNPLFSMVKVVVSIYNDPFPEKFPKDFVDKLKFDGIKGADLKRYEKTDHISLYKSAIDYSEGIIIGEEDIPKELHDYAVASGKPILEYQDPESYIDTYNEFYEKIIS